MKQFRVVYEVYVEYVQGGRWHSRSRFARNKKTAERIKRIYRAIDKYARVSITKLDSVRATIDPDMVEV